MPFLVLGKGTNLLFPDGGIRGVVMKLGRLFSEFSISGTEVRARGGIWVPKLVKNLADAGLSGFEHAAGIPGSLGGLVTMNGGSLRHCAGENIRSVDAVSLAGERRTFVNEECGFSYRRSLFQDPPDVPEKRWIVLGAVLDFRRSEPGAVRREQIRVLGERRGSFPLTCPTAAPCSPTIRRSSSSQALRERSSRTGPQGGTVGGARVSSLHANFIVNLGGASSRDVLGLIGLVRRRVHDRIGVWLDCEVRYADETGKLVPASEACP